MATPKVQRTSISTRILLRLSIPLFVLALVFTAIQLNNRIQSLNKMNELESRTSFQMLHKTLTRDLDRSSSEAFIASIQEKIMNEVAFQAYDQLHILDLIEQRLLFDKNIMEWQAQDFKAAEESIRSYKMGKPYHVHVDRDNHILYAYLPFPGSREGQLLIARARYPLADVTDALATSKYSLVITITIILVTGLIIGQGLAKSIVTPIQKLSEATSEIMEGRLGRRVEINTGDEIEMLSHTFNQMSHRLLDMKQRAEDANPLTQLPGNQGIFHELKRRIMERQKFVLFHADLDRFKIFNDHFGLARGDMAIKKTAELLQAAVGEKGSSDDFVGHQGGDDFVIITRPNNAKAVAEYVCEHFKTNILSALYRREDLDKGFTMAVDRRSLVEGNEEKKVKFPLLAITLAGIANTKKDFADYFDCMSAAAEVKKEAKKTSDSSYLIQE